MNAPNEMNPKPETRNSKLNVMLVDDEELVMNALKRSLRKEDFNLLTASSGMEALEILLKEEVALIISDHRMPGMYGTELLEKARIVSPRTISILLTGYADFGVAEDSINKCRIFKLMTKPWNDQDLKEIIWQALEFYRTGQKRDLPSNSQEENLKPIEPAKPDDASDGLRLMTDKMVHELNNILCAILANTQLILYQKEEGAPVEELKEIESACLRGRDAIRGFQESCGLDKKK
ncbi:MAG: response regulator [bacterium]|nr:response regulator [bacterium]